MIDIVKLHLMAPGSTLTASKEEAVALCFLEKMGLRGFSVVVEQDPWDGVAIYSITKEKGFTHD